MRLLVSGYAGAGNVGDEAILAGLLRTLRTSPDTAGFPVTVLSSDPAATERVHEVAAVPRLGAATIAAIRRADGLISGGGGLFQDVTSGRPPLYYGGVTMLARALGRPYVLLAQGIGPLGGWPQRRMTAHVLAHAALVSVRDPGSMALVRELGVRRPVSLVPDLAFGIEPPRGSHGDRVVVAARGRGLQSSRLSWLRDGVASVAGADEVVVIPMHEPADRAASAALADGLARARVAPAAQVVDDAARTIASARLVVAMRLHALVLATLAGVPAIAVPYDIKVAAFATSVGLPVVEPGTQPVAESFRAAAELARTASAATRTQVDALRERVRPAVEDAVAALASGGTGGSRSAIDATY